LQLFDSTDCILKFLVKLFLQHRSCRFRKFHLYVPFDPRVALSQIRKSYPVLEAFV
jgi:hypothetical protein